MATYLGKAPARLAIVADDQITSAKIVDNTVTSADILNATITGSDLATDITIDTTGTLTSTNCGWFKGTGCCSNNLLLGQYNGNSSVPLVTICTDDVSYEMQNYMDRWIANYTWYKSSPSGKSIMACLIRRNDSCTCFELYNQSNLCSSATSNDVRLATGTSASWIDTTGNFGLGTKSPATKLHVENGEITISDGTTCHQIGNDGNQIYFGANALCSNNGGLGNIAIGYQAMCSNVSGCYNTAVGHQALISNVSDAGSYNTAHGYQALYSNTTGEKNTAIGYQSMYSNTTGEYNAAIGTDSLRSNTIGEQNVALGHNSLYCNTEGFGQVAAGYKSLFNNTTGNYNVAIGAYNLEYNTTGGYNVSVGYCSLNCNTIGCYNVAIGFETLKNNTTGQYNVAIGHQVYCHNTGSDTNYSNVGIGYQAGMCARDNWRVDIGYQAGASTNGTILGGTQTITLGYKAGAIYGGGSYNLIMGTCAGYLVQGGQNNTLIGYKAGCVVTGSCNVALGADALRSETGSNAAFNVAIGRSALNKVANGGGGNTSVGALSGFNIGSGACSVFVGFCSGNATTGVVGNVFVGAFSGVANTTGVSNVAIGYQAMCSNTTGIQNNAVGACALRYNTTGYNNVAIGIQTLYCNTFGSENTAVGFNSMFSNTTGGGNVAIGGDALLCSTIGACNTALGHHTLRLNTTGNYNVAVGRGSLHSNRTGYENTAVGFHSLYDNNGNFNSAVGSGALLYNLTGSCNTGIGNCALRYNSTGNNNVAVGSNALDRNTTGVNNTAVGYRSMCLNTTGTHNVAIGGDTLICNKGVNNTAIGETAGSTVTTGSNLTLLGYNAEPSSPTATNEITLGDASVTDLRVPGAGFYIDDGKVGIGETSMDALLVIKGNSDSSTTPSIRLKDGTDAREAFVTNQSGDLIMATTNSSDDAIDSAIKIYTSQMIFSVDNNTERMRIDGSSGSIRIGSNNSYGLNEKVMIYGSSTANQPTILSSKEASGTASSNHILFQNTNGTVGSIETSGSSTSYNTSSDYRLKENVSYDFDATTRLKQLKPARFNFIADADKTVDGFLAHEVSSIVPEAITGEKDAIETYTDDDGNEQTRPVYQGIDQSKLVPVLTKALQEAITKIEELEVRINTLENV